ncbi:hypothetical protein SAMN05216215_1013109 [Saccharopolyspora shandongensis]|uniref:Uncharacterized protein n=1 Tax=Saccharopolyspora shandongensis TaxID=418495 RepID=A0A1H3DH34_9PSEU|nr:hypothetical protein [Saccharopolyspora shandongensis]SDX65773.1 hypothetical protein SAMN05216215_1013109 [Saccharopolyspora shandongensis]
MGTTSEPSTPDADPPPAEPQTEITPMWWGADERTRQRPDVTSRPHVAGPPTPASDRGTERGWRPTRKGAAVKNAVSNPFAKQKVSPGARRDAEAFNPGNQVPVNQY